MKTNVYVQIKESPSSGYISIESIILEDDINDKYEQTKENRKRFGVAGKMEKLEGFKLRYLLMEVEFDGRKKTISENDILNTLDKQRLVINKGSSMFGGFYLPTDQLKTILEDQLKQRKELVSKGLYEAIA